MTDLASPPESDRTSPRHLTRWWWTGAFTLSCGLTGGVLNAMHPSLWVSIGILLVPCLLLLGMIREANRNAIAKGCATPAGKRYQRRIRIWLPGYIFAIFGAVWMFRHMAITTSLLWPLALLPAVPILGIIWAMGRYVVEEEDEYQRARLISAAMVATGFLLAVTTVWGFFEVFGLVRHIEAYLAFPVWALGLGIGQCVNRWRGA